jgi:tetratricopeptide (TPR) repeat protein
MTDSQHLEDYASGNERSLKRLVRAITLSQGRFSLNFVRCNYAELQAEMQQRLQAACAFEMRYLTLPHSSQTLFTAIKTALGDEQPMALMVSGFESVVALDNLLVATNQVRDNFRKSFAFALVLWVDDEVLKKLMRSAPDFSSWSGVPIQFAITTDALVTLLTRETDVLFARALDVGAGRFPRSSALYPEIGAHSRGQLKLALKELRDRGHRPPPVLAASLQFVLGQAAYADGQMAEARELYEQSLAFWQQEIPTIDATQRLERQGCLLFYLGLWWRRWAVLHRAEQLSAWHKARDYFQECIRVLQAGDRPDLAAKFINALGEVL